MENKKGVTTIALIVVIFIAISLLVVLAIFSYALGLVDHTFLQIDLNVGNTSFNETYQELMQPGLQTLEITVPQNISIGVLLGLVFVLLIVGAKSPKKSNIWIILDIVVIIIAEVVAVAIKISFRDQILNLTPELYNVFTTTLQSGSKWILNLPTLIPTIGVLIIIATYILKKEVNENEDEGGFYQVDDEEY